MPDRSMLPLRFFLLSLVVLIFNSSFLCASPKQEPSTFAVLHSFTGGLDGGGPSSGLTIDRSGNFYGSAGPQTTFRFAHYSSGWVLTPIYQFSGEPYGVYPTGEMTIGSDGRLYGATAYGGPSCDDFGGCGTIYRLQPPATICHSALCFWSETDIYDYYPESESVYPSGRFAQDTAGNFYGTTADENYWGDVFKLAPSGDSWNYSVLYNFTGGADGSAPESGLISDAAGNLYGTATGGGAGDGTVFELSPVGDSWVENTLHTFQNGSDGRDPIGGLTMDSAGNLYGTTYSGGPNGGGTVYVLTPSQGGWQFTVLYAFSGDGYNRFGPTGSLALDPAGNLYGTTSSEGEFGLGSVFQLMKVTGGWTFRELHAFLGPEGSRPKGSVVLGTDGNVYGTASSGGSECGCGTIWEVVP